MSWRTEQNFDEETTAILEITRTFLHQYFDHTLESADRLITDYFQKFSIPNVESYIVQKLSWEMAKQIHFTIELGGERGEIVFWEVENKLRETPREALLYMREHFWSKDYPSVKVLRTDTTD